MTVYDTGTGDDCDVKQVCCDEKEAPPTCAGGSYIRESRSEHFSGLSCQTNINSYQKSFVIPIPLLI